MGLNEAQKKERSEYLEKHLEITECSQRKPYVFVSYASDNWETVFKEAVVPMQKKYGLRVYADKAFDKVNDKWIVPMLRNIRGADAVLAFVSQSYIESYACFLELLTAVNNRKQIIFVSLEERLRLGNTTDLPVVERGAKNEILNQGANISTNTNNTSNDIMRAMKSAYTSILTLLEQDALSKYDISDAFINFFRDASINRKTINDLRAVRGTISSVSKRVFDKALVAEQPTAAPVQTVQPPVQEEPVYQPPVQEEPVYQPPVQEEPVYQPPAQEEPDYQPPAQEEPVYQPPAQEEPVYQLPAQTEPVYQEPVQQPQGEAEFTWEQGKKGGKKPNKRLLLGVAAGVLVAVVMIAVLLLGGSKSVEDQPYTLLCGDDVTYTGKWKNDQPADGEGKLVWEVGNIYEGEFKEGNPNGQGTCTYTDGRSYTGGWATSATLSGASGEGTMTLADGGGTLEGDWDPATGCFIKGTASYANGNVFTGDWDVSTGLMYEGTGTYANGDIFTGVWDSATGNFKSGTATYANGIVYEGEWSIDDGFFCNGTIRFTNGDVYEGQCSGGQLSGQGKYTWPNGDVYEGGWLDGLPQGQGTYTHADGTVESGEWSGGKLSQTLKLADGTYTGGVVDGKPNGWGTMEYTNGQVYVGEWVDGVREGQGHCTRSDGGYYEGEWKNDMYNGQGTAYYGGSEDDPEIDFYVGEFVDGYREGYGTYTWAAGDFFEGEWKKGDRTGQGVYTWADGDKWEGTFVDGEMHGHGKTTFTDGETLEGDWVHGTLNGDYVRTYPDGTVEYEKWDNGTLIETRDQDGNLLDIAS